MKNRKREIIAALLDAGRPDLANVVARLVVAKMSVDEALRVLGIDRDTAGEPSALKDAYRRASLENHPDRGGSKEAMQRVNEAHDLLQKVKFTPRSKREEREATRQEEAEKNAEALGVIRDVLDKSFKPGEFTSHLEQATGKKFQTDVKREETPARYGHPRYTVSAEWRSEDGETVFYLQLSASTIHVQYVKQLGGGGAPDLHFTVSTNVEIIHENRKSKFKQRDWDFTSQRSKIFDPKALFPAAKIQKMLKGKEKKRKFSKRDMELGLKRYLDAHTWYSGKDLIANVPLGKDGMFQVALPDNYPDGPISRSTSFGG